MDWLAVMDAARAESRLVSRAFYPEPRTEFELGNGIFAAAALGEPGYQLSSGETITL